ncbi:hypothetical protein IQ06DRAFT_237078 [Phaeosphaeriaceae sp. SRC1lsM3a]|nr:hypothetical protein IQ06DRAFT_237078 [Stagonospora sp. SRC1lsM3a]
MNHIRATRPLWRLSTTSRRAGQVSRRQRYATEPQTPPQPTPPHTPSSPPNPNTPPTKPPSRVGAYYKSFSYPVLKTFLIALFTYQLAYYAWLKLEVIEEKHDKSTEVADLQEQLREALARQKAKAGDVVEETKEAGRAVAESVKEGGEEVVKATGAVGKVAKGGWWPW